MFVAPLGNYEPEWYTSFVGFRGSWDHIGGDAAQCEELPTLIIKVSR